MRAAAYRRIAELEALRPKSESRRPKIHFAEGNGPTLEIADVEFPTGRDGWRPATPEELAAYQNAVSVAVKQLMEEY
jgi:hypothetical protein